MMTCHRNRNTQLLCTRESIAVKHMLIEHTHWDMSPIAATCRCFSTHVSERARFHEVPKGGFSSLRISTPRAHVDFNIM